MTAGMSGSELLETALHDKHVAMGARMAAEAGWEVPLSYRDAMDEAREVRRRAGVFDVSHFGRIRIRGDGALDLLERACTADVAGQEDETTLSTLLCNDRGGIIDLCRLIRLSSFWVLVTSPDCRQKVLGHLEALIEAAAFDARVDDQTLKTSLLAVSGPAAPEILDAVLPFRVSDISAGAVKFGTLLIARYIAERVSFTGQWSLEVAIPNMAAGHAWRFMTERAGENALAPAGMAAREVLRIEAGLPRYGYELDETVDPMAAGLSAAVAFDHDFLGAETLRKINDKGPARKLIGLMLEPPSSTATGQAILRGGSAVCQTDGRQVGVVTSGTFSVALERSVALAYVGPDTAEVDRQLLVDVDGKPTPAQVTSVPFLNKTDVR